MHHSNIRDDSCRAFSTMLDSGLCEVLCLVDEVLRLVNLCHGILLVQRVPGEGRAVELRGDCLRQCTALHTERLDSALDQTVRVVVRGVALECRGRGGQRSESKCARGRIQLLVCLSEAEPGIVVSGHAVWPLYTRIKSLGQTRLSTPRSACARWTR